MPLPLIPIIAGGAAISAGAALHAWLTSQPEDAWADKAVFNARMRDMHSLAMALNNGFSTCPAFMSNQAQLTTWRGVRDSFSKWYGDVGTLVYTSPSSAEIEQAKSYASKFYFWSGEYERLKCGAPITPSNNTPAPDPYNPYKPPPDPNPTNWAEIIKWSIIGLGGAFLIRTASDLLRPYRR